MGRRLHGMARYLWPDTLDEHCGDMPHEHAEAHGTEFGEMTLRAGAGPRAPGWHPRASMDTSTPPRPRRPKPHLR